MARVPGATTTNDSDDTTGPTRVSKVSKAEVDRLVAGRHGDPHRLLGLHDGVVRALRPDAAGMSLVLPDGSGLPMERIHPGGVFEIDLPSADAAATYRLCADYGNGPGFVYDDPYKAWPTLGELDLHLFGEGRHRSLWTVLGAHHRCHQGVWGASFAVWAPNARAVRVVGDWNFWDGRVQPMRALGSSGVWELFIPGVEAGTKYKFEIIGADGQLRLKADPFAFLMEIPPGTASIVVDEPDYQWQDDDWLSRRAATEHLSSPMSVYEMHVGSWRTCPEEGDRPLTYRELADQLPEYLADLGFTHVEFMPVAEHPFGGSWGYQVSAYYAPTSRFGSPDDFRFLVDRLHQRG